MQWYRQALAKALAKEIDFASDDITLTLHTEIDFASDDITLTLHTSSYTVDADAHDYVDDLTNELTSADGYTTGGKTVANATVTYTAADSWSTQWAGSTAYAVDDIVRPTTGNGCLYRAVSAGTSGSSEPTWPTTVGETVVDNGVTWECGGSGIVVLDGDDVEWDPATFTGVRHLVLSDRTPASASDQPLIGYHTLDSATAADGIFVAGWNSQGILFLLVP